MLYTINELRQKLFQPVYDTYEIFKNFFGEEYVDLQDLPPDEYLLPPEVSMRTFPTTDISDAMLEGIQHQIGNVRPCILIWWPKAKVSNENDRSVEIQDLYAKVEITMEGLIPYENSGFQLTRATFSDMQFASGYIHSHIPRRYGLPSFESPCLGTGPINNTIADLKNGWEEVLWMLFCHELSLYVTVESLRGVPYMKLEEIGYKRKALDKENYYNASYVSVQRLFISEEVDTYNRFWQMVIEFVYFYLNKNQLALCFMGNRYECGMSYYNYMISISNAFIEWFNLYGDADKKDELFSRKILKETLITDGKFYEIFISPYTGRYLIGQRILKFKGQDIRLRVFDSEASERNTSLILNSDLAMYILQNILKIVNYRYHDGNNNIQQQGEADRSPTSPIYQTVFYV